ncbi:site-2 protease family protein [Catellatospora sp. TT07R-123]|uniref:site-2 protease family protein n=1 Tax=Catellatospora sp. TT07R-123 TaxID=2733863 RepID=UPI001B2724F9|nr:site-2 protease family protein [Catellatospora sp. TT07R-123]GHJ46781.1 site-2 protease family protein [Catellatospora sp. TT07R-123]
MSRPAGDAEDPLDRLAAEEDWARRARAVENEVARGRRMRSLRPSLPRRSGGRSGGISLLFVALVALTVVSGVLMWTGTGPAGLLVFVFTLAGWLVTLCLHEFSHALAAHRGGDHTVVEKGYLRLDLRRYGHPVLTWLLPLLFLVMGGLPLPGGAVLIETHRLRNRLRDSLVSAAGPAVNVVAAVLLLFVVGMFGPVFVFDAPDAQAVFWAALSLMAYLQVATALLNLLPVPGLDGYGIIEPYLPPGARRTGEKIKPFGLILVFVLLYVLRGPFGWLTASIMGWTGAPLFGAGYGFDLFRFWQ